MYWLSIVVCHSQLSRHQLCAQLAVCTLYNVVSLPVGPLPHLWRNQLSRHQLCTQIVVQSCPSTSCPVVLLPSVPQSVTPPPVVCATSCTALIVPLPVGPLPVVLLLSVTQSVVPPPVVYANSCTALSLYQLGRYQLSCRHLFPNKFSHHQLCTQLAVQIPLPVGRW